MKQLFQLLLLFIGLNVSAQNALTLGDAQQAGFSKEGLARVDSFLKTETTNKVIPGSIGMIVRNGKVVYKKAFGKANIEKNESMRTDHLFRMASMTKIVTAVAALKLYERGLFTMETPLEQILPEFKEMQVLIGYDEVNKKFITRPAKNKILMKHLFTHTSGVVYPPFATTGKEGYIKSDVPTAFPKAHNNKSLATIIKDAAKLPLAHEPGESWTYGINLDILGRVIEVLDGRSFPDFLRQEIFIPLKMKRTFIGVPSNEWNNLAQVYTKDNSGNFTIYDDGVAKSLLGISTASSMDYWKDTDTKVAFGGSDIVSCVDDYARFFQMILNYGHLDGVQIIGKKTVEMIEKTHYDLETKDPVSFVVAGSTKFRSGISVYVYPEEQVKFEEISAGTYFWLGYFGTQFWIDRKENMFAIIMTQIAPETTGHNNKFRHFVWGSIAK